MLSKENPARSSIALKGKVSARHLLGVDVPAPRGKPFPDRKGGHESE